VSKALKFFVGDTVEILPTATEQKYSAHPHNFPRWVSPMERDVGQTGTVVYVYTEGVVEVEVSSARYAWAWRPEDLRLTTSKWRRRECR